MRSPHVLLNVWLSFLISILFLNGYEHRLLKITVPDLVGLSGNEAISVCENAGLNYSISEGESDSVEKGFVISQQIPAGEEVDERATLMFRVSIGAPVTTTTAPMATTTAPTTTTTTAPATTTTFTTTSTPVSTTKVTDAAYSERQITYSDGWYSVFTYDNNKNIIKMSLYDKNGKQRLIADYEYTGNDVKRTVYVDNNLYKAGNVKFTDIMADIEKEKKERANTTKEYEEMGVKCWDVYDGNGDRIEHRRYHVSGNYEYSQKISYKNGKKNELHSSSGGGDHTTYYDEKGYPSKSEYNSPWEKLNYSYTFTYQYDDNGYPIVQYANGEKSCEYTNYYMDNNLGYTICQFKQIIAGEHRQEHWIGADDGKNTDTTFRNSPDMDKGLELNKNGQYVRGVGHYYEYRENAEYEILQNAYTTYYIPSFDGTKMIDSITVWYPNGKRLFECPYCSE